MLTSSIGAFVVFDVCSGESFSGLNQWIHDLKQNTSPSIVVFVVGNKIDERDR